MMRRSVVQSVILLALVLSSGCGYSLAGRGSFLPPHIQSIGVPMFANHTSVFDVDRRVTERVVSELIGRGKYRVERSETGVDAVLSGEITSIALTPAATNQQRQAVRYVIVLTAKVEFRDLKENKVLWHNPAMQYREDFEVSGVATDPNAFFGQDVNALDRLASEFARSLVSAILEAF